MKKKTIIIALLMLVICVICAVFVFVFVRNNSGDRQREQLTQLAVADLLHATNVEEIKNAAKSVGYEIEEYEGLYAVTVDDFYEMLFQVAFSIENGNVVHMSCFFESKKNSSELSIPDDIEQQLGVIKGVCNELFIGSIENSHFNIYADDGRVLRVDNVEAYNILATNEAKLGLYVREADTFWKITSTVFEEKLTFNFERFFNTEIYADFSADFEIE